MVTSPEPTASGADPDLAVRLAATLERIAEPVGEPATDAARRVGEAVRTLIDRLTATSAPAEVLHEIAALVEAAVRPLAPHDSVRRYEGVSETSGLFHDRAFFDWSPLLGLANPVAPPMHVRVTEGRVEATARFGLAYEGPPGCVHGGFVAAAFDEVLGLTQSLSGRVGMTGTLTVRYRRPTPLRRELRFVGTLDEILGRKVLTSGRVYDGEDLTAEAEAVFVTITPEKFRSLSTQRLPVPPDGSQ